MRCINRANPIQFPSCSKANDVIGKPGGGPTQHRGDRRGGGGTAEKAAREKNAQIPSLVGGWGQGGVSAKNLTSRGQTNGLKMAQNGLKKNLTPEVKHSHTTIAGENDQLCRPGWGSGCLHKAGAGTVAAY